MDEISVPKRKIERLIEVDVTWNNSGFVSVQIWVFYSMIYLLIKTLGGVRDLKGPYYALRVLPFL